MQNIKTVLKNRLNTGAVQFDNDWPGLFIRGDDCMELRFIIKNILAENPKPLSEFEKNVLARYFCEINDQII